jgi:lectin family protein
VGFTAFTGTQPSDWTANGSAVYDAPDDAAQLTDANDGEAGTWVYDRAILADPITVQFDFYMSGGGADGIGLVFMTNGTSALGNGAQGLGMSGLTGFGVEIDDYDNDTCLDSNQNHIGIDSLDVCPGGIEPNTLFVNNSPGINVDDGNWHTVVVNVVSGVFTVTADGNSVFAKQATTGWPSNPTYYLAFTGGTGGLAEYHRVRNVSVSFPKARCF